MFALYERRNMYGRTETSCIVGIDGARVIVEADYGDGLPEFSMVGFLSSEVKEARERVRAALKNSGITVPPGRLTVNLSPADLKKQGNSFDLPIAIAIMVSLGILPQQVVEGILLVGELSLEGELRSVNGTLSHVLAAKERGMKACVLPKANAREGAVLSELDVYGFETLREVMNFLLEPAGAEKERADCTYDESVHVLDFSEILGQESVKRAAAVASAGMHGFLMIGPPGSGKTLTAKRIPTILPPLSEAEQIECSKIHSVAGTLDRESGLIRARPFRSPHHTITASGLIGGGTIPKPGEMSLAHNGVLFLDELAEHNRNTLDLLRNPLEDKKITISRLNSSCVFPTKVMLVCAMNPCKCGFYPGARCQCSERDVRRYLSHISKPLLDRIDITVEVPAVSMEDLEKKGRTASSAEMRDLVIRAWEVQKERYKGRTDVFNAHLEGSEVRKYCGLDAAGQELMRRSFDSLGLSARAHDRILKVARTIADMEGAERISTAHLAEAISYRSLDRKFWAG